MIARPARCSLPGLALLIALAGGMVASPFGTASVAARSAPGDVLGGPAADPAAVGCANFRSQADAQAVLDADSSDPYKLDQGGTSGVACETPGDINTGPLVTCRDLQTAETAQALLEAASGDPYGLDPDGDRVACNGTPPGDSTTGGGGKTSTGTGTRPGGGRGTRGSANHGGNARTDVGTVPASQAAAAPPPTPGGGVTGPTDCRIVVQTDRSFAGVDCAGTGATAGHLPPNAGNLADLGAAIRSRFEAAAAAAETRARARVGGSATIDASGGTSVERGGTATANADGGAVAIGTVSRGETVPGSAGGRRSAAQGRTGDPATSAQRVHGGKHRHHGSQGQRRHGRP